MLINLIKFWSLFSFLQVTIFYLLYLTLGYKGDVNGMAITGATYFSLIAFPLIVLGTYFLQVLIRLILGSLKFKLLYPLYSLWVIIIFHTLFLLHGYPSVFFRIFDLILDNRANYLFNFFYVVSILVPLLITPIILNKVRHKIFTQNDVYDK